MKQTKGVVDVLIVGAGPSGLMLACDLARRGVSLRLVDKLPVASDKSRALILQARSVEIFDQLGLAAQLLAAGTRIRESHFMIDGKLALNLDLSHIDIEGVPFPFILTVVQDETEAILTAGLRDLGETVERSVELVGFEQSADLVRSRLRHADGHTEVVESRYIVGCDGAHSVVRHGLGLKFEGDAYPQDFILADVEVDWDVPRDQFRIMLTKEGLLAAFPMTGARRIRLLASRRKAPEQLADPTLEDFQSLVDHFFGLPGRLSNPHWLASFRLHHRLAERYSSGRAFLCGDAAHIHSPAGGQGMNTGIQDAWNLGWKLDLVLKGKAAPGLLESYSEERHPVGQLLMETTDRLFQMGTSGGAMVTFVRRHVAPTLAKAVLSQPSLRRLVLGGLTQVGINYRKSRIVADAAHASHALSEGPLAGDRAPDASLTAPDGTSTRLFEQLRGTRHHWLLFQGELTDADVESRSRGVREAAAAWSGLLDVVVVRTSAAPVGLRDSGDAHRRFGVRKHAQFLVRPDGHVAWRAAGWESRELSTFLERIHLRA